MTASAEHLFGRAPFDGCLWQYIVGKTVIFQQILIFLEKPGYPPVYSLFEVVSNEKIFKLFVGNSPLPNCKEGYQEGGFYSKYLQRSCVNKWG